MSDQVELFPALSVGRLQKQYLSKRLDMQHAWSTRPKMKSLDVAHLAIGEKMSFEESEYNKKNDVKRSIAQQGQELNRGFRILYKVKTILVERIF